MTEAKRSFLLATAELGGLVSPMLTVAAKLRARGHNVRVMSDACNRAEAEAAGVRFLPWTRAPNKSSRAREHELLKDWQAATPAEGIGMLFGDILVGGAAGYAADLKAELRREPADLVVSCEFLFGVQAACEANGQKFVMFSANIPLLPLQGIPPLGPGLTPARTDEERALHAEIAEGAHAMFDQFLPRFNGVRAELGLAPLARLADQHKAAQAFLLGTSRAFDFAPEHLPEGIAYVGPQLDEPAWAKPWAQPGNWTPGRKRALAAFSTTFQNHAGVLQRVIDAMAAVPLDGVVTLGGSIYAHELNAPAGVALLESAPHGLAMAATDIVITHGGHGTVMKALCACKPMLILPHGRDQNDNAVRVTERGAGLSLPADTGTDLIGSALSRLVQEPHFAAAARRLGAEIAAEAVHSPIVGILETAAGGGRICLNQTALRKPAA